MAQLTKRQVESLLASYDHDPVGALTTALQIVLELPGATWRELVEATRLGEERKHPLVAEHLDALDRLAAELNELRELPRAPAPDSPA
jgi:hypothetical protein